MAKRPRNIGQRQQGGDNAPRGLKRAMRGLQGFAGQATAAYGKLTVNIEKLIPSVKSLGRAWAKMRDAVKESIPHIDAAANSIMRTRYAIATTIPLVSSMATQFAALGASMRAAGMIGQSSMTGLAASTLKASAATGVFGTSLAAIAVPLGIVAAAAGLVYVSVAKWNELPFLLKAFLLAASPLVVVVRALANAWSLLTLPVRMFRASIDGLKSLVGGVASGMAALVAMVGRLGQGLAALAMRGVRGLASGLSWLAATAKNAFSGISKALVGLGESVGRAGAWLSSMAGKVVDPLTRAADEFGKAGAAALVMAGAVGLSTDQLSALGYAAEQSGATVEAMADAVKNANRTVEAAIGGNQTAAESFRRLGLDAGRLAGMNAADRFTEIGVAIASLADESERAEAAQAIFGAENEALIGMFGKGAAGLADMRREAERLGLVMSGPQAQAAKDLSDATKGATNAWLGLWRTLGAAVAPQLTETAKRVTTLVSAVTQWAAKNQPLIASVFKVASTVALAGSSLTAIAGVLTALTPGVVTLTAALAAGWLAWGRYGDNAANALGAVLPMLESIKVESLRVLGGVWDAIQGGDLELAVHIAWLGAQKAWIAGLQALASVTNDTMAGIFQALAAGDWRSALSQAWLAVQEIYTQGMMSLDDVFTGLTNTIDATITYLRQQFNVVVSELAKLGIRAMDTANKVASAMAEYDPTGRVQKMQIAAAKAMKGSGLFAAAGAPDAENAALGEESRQRGFGRLQDLLGRQSERSIRLAELSGLRVPLAEGAGQAAGAAGAGVQTRLEAAMSAALKAREDAQKANGVDVERKNRLAAAAGGAATSTGMAGATFSGAALLASGGANAVQKEIASNTRIMAKALQQLAASDKKRERENLALQAMVVA